jgi:hypothetical protein
MHLGQVTAILTGRVKILVRIDAVADVRGG